MTARSKAWVYGRSLAGIAGSNPCLSLARVRVVRYRSLRQAHDSSRGVLTEGVVCLGAVWKPQHCKRSIKMYGG